MELQTCRKPLCSLTFAGACLHREFAGLDPVFENRPIASRQNERPH